MLTYIILLRKENNIVKLYDILSADNFNLENIILKIIRKDDKKVQFNFIPKSKGYKIDFKNKSYKKICNEAYILK